MQCSLFSLHYLTFARLLNLLLSSLLTFLNCDQLCHILIFYHKLIFSEGYFPAGGFHCALDQILVSFLYKKLSRKNPPGKAGDSGLIPGSGRSPGEGSPLQWEPTPVFLLGKSHRQRSLAGYGPWGRKGAKHDSMSKPPPLYVIYYFSMLKQGRDPSQLILPSCQGNS